MCCDCRVLQDSPPGRPAQGDDARWLQEQKFVDEPDRAAAVDNIRRILEPL
jgi:hypothetical protein